MIWSLCRRCRPESSQSSTSITDITHKQLWDPYRIILVWNPDHSRSLIGITWHIFPSGWIFAFLSSNHDRIVKWRPLAHGLVRIHYDCPFTARTRFDTTRVYSIVFIDCDSLTMIHWPRSQIIDETVRLNSGAVQAKIASPQYEFTKVVVL